MQKVENSFGSLKNSCTFAVQRVWVIPPTVPKPPLYRVAFLLIILYLFIYNINDFFKPIISLSLIFFNPFFHSI